MSKGIILFQSKYGATKKYADWLAEKTGYACVETKNANAVDMKPYDVILLGGRCIRFRHCRIPILKEKYQSVSR